MESSAAAQQMPNINDYCPFLDAPYVTVAKGNSTFVCQYLYKYHPLILESPLSTYAVLEKCNISKLLDVLSSSLPFQTSPSRKKFCLLNCMSSFGALLCDAHCILLYTYNSYMHLGSTSLVRP